MSKFIRYGEYDYIQYAKRDDAIISVIVGFVTLVACIAVGLVIGANV